MVKSYKTKLQKVSQARNQLLKYYKTEK